MLATSGTTDATSTTPSAAHMSYGAGLASPSAAAYGASSLSAYGSTYPYGTLVSKFCKFSRKNLLSSILFEYLC